MDLRVRPAAADDARAIARIHVEGWQWAYRGLMPDALLSAQRVETREALWTKLLANPPPRTSVHLAAHGDDAIGFVWCAVARDIDLSNAGEMVALYLREESMAGRGIGRMLMDAAIRSLRAEHFDRASLWVLDTNERARRFYERAGFVADGATKVEAIDGVPLPHVRYGRDLRSI